MESHQFPNFPGQLKSEELIMGPPRNTGRQARNLKRTTFAKSVFSHTLRFQSFQRPMCPDLDSKITTKSDLATCPTMKWYFNPHCPKGFQNPVQSTPNRHTSDSRPTHIFPAAAMVPQGAPKVLKWLPMVPERSNKPSELQFWQLQ